ncbi:efflux RND transporter periplasmic adaptor subunit [Thiomicrorhabdus sp. 6S3-12]|uniref:efflux RND transporter periplasmic adaptor subunit n=1 Tax=Thiomicrorhabdus sp. 6S3-12 TaxID=2819681 RepID=UPI001AADDC7E|nr:efflux RND transporter periplasmic adaptor subunit [Thiomicrorhabdus sp. 6S3-12]MBO1924913.1 efflux RND transporter periplasmic adaptor subunit [Thiomicrorhabdus sp. 6S3-12]
MQKIKYLNWAGSLFIGLAVLGIAGCQQQQETPETPLLKVKTVLIEQSQQQSRWFLNGTLQAKTTIDLSFRVAGEVAQLNVDLGDRVDADQPLIHLDPADYQLSVTSAQANIRATAAEINQTRSDLKRITALQQRKLASEQAKQQLENQLKVLEAQQKANQQQLQQAQNQLDYTQLKAPVSGIILAKLVEANQVVSAGQPVLQLIADGKREVLVDVPENRLASLPKQGQIRLQGHEYPVELRTLEPQADAASRTWTAFYRIPESEEINALPLGQTVRVQFSQTLSGIRLPLSALYEQGDYRSVWLLQEGKAKRVPVQILRIDRDSAWVAGEFPENSKVIALGVHLLSEGQALEEMP